MSRDQKELKDLANQAWDIYANQIADSAERMAKKEETKGLTGEEALMRFARALRSST